MRTGWDIDGVGHVFSAGFHDHMYCEGIEDLWKSGPNADPYWNWYEDYGWSLQEFVEFCNRAADHGCLFTGHVRPGYFESMERVANLGHEIIIVTDRAFGASPEVSEWLTVEWLRANDANYDELIFSRDKTVGNCDTFIDDKLENYDALTNAGVNAFLLNQPWNRVDKPDYRKRIDTVEEYADLIEKHGYKLIYKKVFVSN